MHNDWMFIHIMLSSILRTQAEIDLKQSVSNILIQCVSWFLFTLIHLIWNSPHSVHRDRSPLQKIWVRELSTIHRAEIFCAAYKYPQLIDKSIKHVRWLKIQLAFLSIRAYNNIFQRNFFFAVGKKIKSLCVKLISNRHELFI